MQYAAAQKTTIMQIFKKDLLIGIEANLNKFSELHTQVLQNVTSNCERRHRVTN